MPVLRSFAVGVVVAGWIAVADGCATLDPEPQGTSEGRVTTPPGVPPSLPIPPAVDVVGCTLPRACKNGTLPDGAPCGGIVVAGCPDPTTNCCHLNGTGIYTAEAGYAGIGYFQLMITHFINNPSCDSDGGPCVTFDGRYLDWRAPVSRALGGFLLGEVRGATFDGELMKVAAVSETASVPRWTLRNATTERIVTGDELRHLTLSIFVVALIYDGVDRSSEIIGGEQLHYEVTFGGVGSIADPTPATTYNMRWRREEPGAPWRQYCVRPDGAGDFADDPVVFQQSIDVDPTNGRVDHKSTENLVTLSCAGGAPAVVYSWGYDYTGAENTHYFDAAIEMKRASYCGDTHAYTVAGTPITIADRLGRKGKSVTNLEAFWTPEGASCINLQNRRHPELGFTGACSGKVLPRCSTLPSDYLGDGRVMKPPAGP